MKSIRLFIILIIMILHGMIYAQYGYYPPASSINYQPDTLTIYPPDSLPGDPVVLLGYNIYVDEDFYGNVMVSDPLEVVDYYLDDESLVPGTRVFCANAVYNDWISESACDTAFIAYGYELPFYEDWSSGSFETLQWTTNSDHWVVEAGEGNPSPSVVFHGEPGLTDYEASLESFPMTAIGMTIGIIWLDFEIKLEATQATGDEKLTIQVWNSISQVWTTVAEYDNEEGNLSWEWEHLNIKNQAQNKVFKFRFLAKGVNSADISSWQIDNIKVYRKCSGPDDLELVENWEYNELNWEVPDIGFYEDWLQWDDGMNSGNSIGLNDTVEFDAAAKWTPNILASYGSNMTINKIAFFPAEPSATYRVKIWSGAGPDTLLWDQLVINPVMHAWNTVDLEIPVAIDISKDLWVGYHISTPTGWPAGVDDGPAMNGYGNLMYYDSTWTTLLDINEELDFNWNIAFHFFSFPYDEDLTYYIYRDVNQQGFEYQDQSMTWYYKDLNIELSNYYCYKVTLVWAGDSDTCESNPTNSACEELMLGTNQPEDIGQIRIYPNPASSYLNIESPEKIGEVRVYNLLGECELKLEIGNWEGKVDVRGLESGVYFVEVVTGKLNYKDKILIFR